MKKAFIALALCAAFTSANAQTLKETVGQKMLIGTALNVRQVNGMDPKGLDIVKQHFNCVVAVKMLLLILQKTHNKKRGSALLNLFYQVGVTGLEPATTRPPDAYANQLRHTPSWLIGGNLRKGLLPNCECKSTAFFRISKHFWRFFTVMWAKKCNFVADTPSGIEIWQGDFARQRLCLTILSVSRK